MGLTARGVARIRHRATGEVYEIAAEELDWQNAASDERQMGPEVAHVAQIEHPELGTLTWEVWEYPHGMENDRETDIGGHILLENFSISLSADTDPDDLRDRAEELVEWFFERYEDPAQRTPYESAEGGYQWIWGGPYDAREVLNNNFANELPAILEAAVRRIERDGFDWVRTPSAEDYDPADEEYDADPAPGADGGFNPEDTDPEELSRALDQALRSIPPPDPGPRFEASADRIDLVGWTGDEGPAPTSPLLQELREAAEALTQALHGTNAHQELLEAATRYRDAIRCDSPAIPQVYARGVALENMNEAAASAVALQERPALPTIAHARLRTALQLHAAFIMGASEGRQLAEGARDYQLPPPDAAALRNAAQQLSEAVQEAHHLIGPAARQAVAEAAAMINTGPHPERSTQVGQTTIGNLLKGFGPVLVFYSGEMLLSLAGNALGASQIGAAGIKGGAALIDAAWQFLLTQAPLLKTFAAVAGADVRWLSELSGVVLRIKNYWRRPPPKDAHSSP